MFAIDLKGKLAWVTGGSRGIGKAICQSLAEAGCDVVVGYRGSEDAAHEVCALVRDLGCRSMAVQIDVSNAESCTQAYKQIKEKLGAVEILVNSAGVVEDNLFLMLSEDDWDRVISTNLMGTVRTSKLVAKDMLGKRWGRIINLSSVAAQKSGRGQSNYAASKAAVEAMSRSLACELGRRGITVNCIAPGVVETDMTIDVRAAAEKEIIDRQIIKRFANPSEIAAWAVFLASEHSGYMTGEVIAINGGIKGE